MTRAFPPRPNYGAHARAFRSAFPDVVTELRQLLGVRLCAVLGSVQETRVVEQWTKGPRKPPATVQRRLRVALQAAAPIAEVDSAAVAQAWLLGMNPLLDDRSPLLLLSEGDLDDVEPAVIGAARSFVGAGASVPDELVAPIVEDLKTRGVTDIEPVVVAEETVEFRAPEELEL